LSDPDPDRTVVISGIGLATALGSTREATWAGLRAGRSGAAWLDRLELQPGFAGFPLEPWPWSDHPEPALGLLEQIVAEAVLDSGFLDGNFDRDRVGVLVGLSKGGLRSLAETERWTRSDDGDDLALAEAWRRAWPSSGASTISRAYDWRGPSVAPVAACATGLIAALQGLDLIRRGVCDVVLAGSADASLEPIVLGAFRRMKVLARVDDDPKRAVRPWSRDRSGFLVGEGGAILVLERFGAVRARGGTAYAELAGGAIGSDAFHETGLDPDPSGFARLIARALRDASVAPEQIAAVNVHGTATGPNDPLECRAIRQAFGPTADRLACSANKAQVGHLLGAAGSVELAITALSVSRGFAPPTLNLDDPDPACDLDGTPHSGRSLAIPAALKLSLGFGGHLAAAVLKRIDPFPQALGPGGPNRLLR